MYSLAFSVSSSCLPAFLSPPSFRAFYNLLTVLRGCFTPVGLIYILRFSPFLFFSPFSFLSPLFSFFPPFFSFSLSLSHSLSLSCRFLMRRPPPCRTASDGPAAWQKDTKQWKKQNKTKQTNKQKKKTLVISPAPWYFWNNVIVDEKRHN